MLIIRTKSGGNGAFPPILSCEREMPPEGYALWPEELDTADFYNHNGFVNLTIGESERVVQDRTVAVLVVKNYAPNAQAWEAWKAARPFGPEPITPTEDSSVWDELDAAYQEGVDSV